MKPLSESVTESAYQTVVEALQLGQLSPSDRIKGLLEVDVKRMLSSIPPTMQQLPTLGGELGIKEPTFAEVHQGLSGTSVLPSRSWCKEIMIGDCQMDVSIDGSSRVERVSSH